MDAILIFLVFFLGFVFINSFKNKISSGDIQSLKNLFCYHIFFGLYNYFFIGSDPIRYWKLAKEITYEQFIVYLTEKSGTYFMFALDYYPSNVMELSYFTGTMLYTVIGFIGIALFYLTALELIPNDPKFKGYYLFPLLFFAPNLHFWSCTAGKDTLSFFCIALFTYGFLNPFKRLPMLIIALLLSYAVRPHIALFLLLGFGLSLIMSEKTNFLQRVVFTIAFIFIGIMILPSVMEYAKIEEVTVDSFNDFASNKSDLLSRSTTGSRIDISSYPFPLKIFTFLYRPLFFDINGIPAVFASFENLIWLILSIQVFRMKPRETFSKAPEVVKGLMLFLVVGTLAFSQSLGNLGIIIRMKNMFLPGLIIYFLWAFSYQEERRLKEMNKI